MHGVGGREEVGHGLPTTLPGPTQAAPLVHSYFKREVGSVARAQLHFGEYSKLPKPTSQAAQRGLRYEKKVLSHLLKTFGNRLVAGPLFTFKEEGYYLTGKGHPYPPARKAYPDALLFSSDYRAVCVVECKFRHTGDAWHQLNKFYLPIVRAALPWFRVCVLEVVASYDPSQRLPQPVAFVNDVNEAFATREAFHPVYVLTERELRNDRGLG